MKPTFPYQPPIGFQVNIGKQTFTFVGPRPHTNRHGEETSMLGWETECADCGRVFTACTATKFEPSRRCADHRKPGKRA